MTCPHSAEMALAITQLTVGRDTGPASGYDTPVNRSLTSQSRDATPASFARSEIRAFTGGPLISNIRDGPQ
jgi:hypothetical protein